MPICQSGHKLRSQILGDLTELSLAPALLRGLFFSGLAIIFGMLQDLRLGRDGRPLGLLMTTGMTLIVGAIALNDSWTWAGRDGPVHRLTARAFGMAMGCFVPAIIASHALYFHWAVFAERAWGNGIIRLIRVSGFLSQ
jgi:hypothetical protein